MYIILNVLGWLGSAIFLMHFTCDFVAKGFSIEGLLSSFCKFYSHYSVLLSKFDIYFLHETVFLGLGFQLPLN